MTNTGTIKSSVLKGMLAGKRAGIISGLIGSIFFSEFWIAIASTATKQVAAMPFWLSVVFGVFFGVMLGFAAARIIGKQLLLFAAIGITVGVVIVRSNIVVRILTAILSALEGKGGGMLLTILSLAFMLITNAMLLTTPGKVLGALLGVILKFKGLLIIWSIVSVILLVSMWGIHTLYSLGTAGNWLSRTLVGIFIGSIGTNRAVTNIFENNREGGTVDRIFGGEKKVQTVEEIEVETIIISGISLVGGVVGAILGGLGFLSFE